MAICPATLKPCIDDLCYGGGCMNPLAYGEPMLTECVGCGKLIAADGSDTDGCECDPDEWGDDDEPGDG
jgi:hypothetical protein